MGLFGGRRLRGSEGPRGGGGGGGGLRKNFPPFLPSFSCSSSLFFPPSFFLNFPHFPVLNWQWQSRDDGSSILMLNLMMGINGEAVIRCGPRSTLTSSMVVIPLSA
jgi:hypothetical protein